MLTNKLKLEKYINITKGNNNYFSIYIYRQSAFILVHKVYKHSTLINIYDMILIFT